MRLGNLVVLGPLALLAACGGSESGENAGNAATEAPATSEPAAPEAAATTEAAPAAAPASPAAAGAPAVAAAPPAFAICKTCHAVEPGKNGVGPSLFGVVGSKPGDVAGYAFSPALKAAGITWNRDTLDTWLQGPMKMVPGTKMVIAVPDAANRKAIIDYLETLK